jgi:hypothetical protein
MTGRGHLVTQALQTAFLTPAPRTLFCGGEERGTWLLERGYASARTFAFAVSLTRSAAGALASVALTVSPGASGELTLQEFFDALQQRRTIDRALSPGWRLELTWL